MPVATRRGRAFRALLIGLGVGLLAAAGATSVLVWLQGRRVPEGDARYVAMGSSFAAGIGLGARAPDSPLLCMRSTNGYPSQLARLLDLPLLDVSCSGATTAHVLRGGQYFQRAQLDAVSPSTRLVTITSGGNDISLVTDMSLDAAGNRGSVVGWLARRLRRPALPPDRRDYEGVRRDLVAAVREAKRRAPDATVVLATYPAILPPHGSCDRLGLTPAQADAMRTVADRLAAATRQAAEASGALLVDMHALGAEHHACSAEPWTNGWVDADGTRFHPTLAGAQATARAIAAAIRART